MSIPRLLLNAYEATRQFGDGRAVDGVTMSVSSGEVVGLLGANGAGKTTLLRLLLGLLPTTSGHVELLGGAPDRDRRRRLGYVPQGLGLYADLSVRENVDFHARMYRTEAPALPDSLRHKGEALVGELPMGTQRELAFVVALSHEIDALVLDEPTSGVTALTRSQLWETIHSQAERGVGVLVTTHHMSEAEQCDRLLLMSQGRLVASGSISDVVGDTRAVRVATDRWERAFAVLGDAGEPVMLAGRTIRVPDADPRRLHELLANEGIAASVSYVPATIEERMMVLARDAARS